jgi:transcriptional regulator with XRE-family HTH domain
VEIAAMLGMRKESLSRKINGKLNITLGQINELAKLLAIEPIDLLQEVKDELYRGER